MFLRNVYLVDLTQVLDHLVSPCEAVIAATMAAGKLAVNVLVRFPVVLDENMSF